MRQSPTTTLEGKANRRGLLALIGAGGAAAVAALLGRSQNAEAHGTTHTTSTTSDPAIHGDNTSVGPGVVGSAVTGNGVTGTSGGTGVAGAGTDSNSIGVSGTSTGLILLVPSGRIGVWGVGDTTGVLATGAKGVSASGTTVGVLGIGTGAGSTGVRAINSPGRRGLRTKGQVQMDCARKKTLANKSNLLTLPPGVRAGANAAVMAAAQGNPGNDAVIWRAYRVDSTHIRIAFNKKPAKPVSVAYWVVHTG